MMFVCWDYKGKIESFSIFYNQFEFDLTEIVACM